MMVDDCDHGEVRLGDGTAVSNGRVEVCMDGVWGRVCSDQWDNVDASVVCSQLGFNDQGMHIHTIHIVHIIPLRITLFYTVVGQQLHSNVAIHVCAYTIILIQVH